MNHSDKNYFPLRQGSNDPKGNSDTIRAASSVSEKRAIVSVSTGKMAVTWNLGNMTLAQQSNRGRTSTHWVRKAER